MQRDYRALETVPRAIFSQPDFDPLTGLWVNPQPEDARKSLAAAWVAAVNERERHGKRPKTWGRVEAAAPDPEIVLKSPRPWVSWIERTLNSRPPTLARRLDGGDLRAQIASIAWVRGVKLRPGCQVFCLLHLCK
jgi:hypothetical protein